ncbi:hypothetical protein D915_002495, partial [Fasciola hepatica]
NTLTTTTEFTTTISTATTTKTTPSNSDLTTITIERTTNPRTSSPASSSTKQITTTTTTNTTTSSTLSSKTLSTFTESATFSVTVGSSSSSAGPSSLFPSVEVAKFTIVAKIFTTWDSDLEDASSDKFQQLSQRVCEVLVKAVQTIGNHGLSVPKCAVLQLTNLSSRQKRSISRQKRAISADVSSTCTLTFADSTANHLEASTFESLLTSGFSQLSSYDRSLLYGSFQVTKILMTATCETSGSTCSSQATCTDYPKGFSCTCNPFFIERKNTTPGTVCDLHPGTIAFIVIGSLFVLGMIGMLIYFVIRHVRGQSLCPCCFQEDEV